MENTAESSLIKNMNTDIISNAKSVLGDDYEGLFAFFSKIFLRIKTEEAAKKDILYVFANRRCHVLMQFFSQIFRFYVGEGSESITDKIRAQLKCFKGPDDVRNIMEKHFVTSTAFISMGESYAKIKKEEIDNLDITVVDDLLIYGRTLNNIMVKFEDNLRCRAKEEGTLDNVEGIISKIKYKVYSINDGPMLLYRKYQRRLAYKNSIKRDKINEFSYKLYNLFSTLAISTAAFSFGSNINIKKMNEVCSSSAFFTCLDTAVSNINLNKIETEIDNIKQIFYARSYKSKSNNRTNIIATLRCKEHEGQILMIPFVIYGAMGLDKYKKIHDCIIKDFVEDKPEDKPEDNPIRILLNSEYYKKIGDEDFVKTHYYRMIQSMHFFLSAMMLVIIDKNYSIKCKEDEDEGKIVEKVRILDNVNYDFIGRNFYYNRSKETNRNNNVVGGETLREVVTCLSVYKGTDGDSVKSLFDKYMGMIAGEDIVLNAGEADGIFDGEYEFESERIKEIENLSDEVRNYHLRAVKTFVSKISSDSERDAHLRVTGNIGSSSESLRTRGGDVNLNDCIKQIRGIYLKYNRKAKFSVELVMAFLVQMVSFNVLGMEPDYSSKKICLAVRHGEPASFQLIKDYNKYMVGLKRLVDDWDIESSVFKTLLNKYARAIFIDKQDKNGDTIVKQDDKEKLIIQIEKEISEITNGIINSGHSISEWCFPMVNEKVEMQKEQEGKAKRQKEQGAKAKRQIDQILFWYKFKKEGMYVQNND